MSSNEMIPLVVDEPLLQLALQTFARLEEEAPKFELLNVTGEFSRSDGITARFAELTGKSIEQETRDAIDYYIAATYLLHHRNGNLEELQQVLAELDSSTARFVRTAGWTFLQAWNLRYGGLYSRLVLRGSTLIDGSIDDPRSR